jgi:hypothetical protein
MQDTCNGKYSDPRPKISPQTRKGHWLVNRDLLEFGDRVMPRSLRKCSCERALRAHLEARVFFCLLVLGAPVFDLAMARFGYRQSQSLHVSDIATQSVLTGSELDMEQGPMRGSRCRNERILLVRGRSPTRTFFAVSRRQTRSKGGARTGQCAEEDVAGKARSELLDAHFECADGIIEDLKLADEDLETKDQGIDLIGVLGQPRRDTICNAYRKLTHGRTAPSRTGRANFPHPALQSLGN